MSDGLPWDYCCRVCRRMIENYVFRLARTKPGCIDETLCYFCNRGEKLAQAYAEMLAAEIIQSE